MTISEAVVYIVDDDELIRNSLEILVKSVGIQAETFSSAQLFLETILSDRPACLVLDIRMPGLSGLDLQSELQNMSVSIPIVFITGHGTVPMSVKAMKAGAVDFLTKPFEDQELLDAIQQAIKQHDHIRIEENKVNNIRRRMQTLTSREYEVLLLVISGMLNKQIASDLNLSENTVKTHRARLMRKLEVDSLAELVRSSIKAGIHTPSKNC